MTPTPSRRDGLAIGELPAPGAGAVATGGYALLVDLCDGCASPSAQRLGRPHLGASRQLPFSQPIAAILDELGLAPIRPRTAGAVGALVHLAARAEVADLAILRPP